MKLTLKVVSGKHAGQKLGIPPPNFLIGRGEECQLRPNSDLVSRRHCLLLIGPDGVTIRDLQSRNGTFVNGERLVGDHALESGDQIRVGRLEFEVQLELRYSASATPPVRAPAGDTKPASPLGDEDLDILKLFREAPSPAIGDTIGLATSETIPATTEPAPDAPPEGRPASSPAPSHPTSRESPPLRRSQFADGGEAAARTLRKMLRGGSS